MKEKVNFESNAIADFAERYINQTNQSIFLTGKAGTGKTTLLRKIVEHTHKRTVIVAPTGIAALNAGGVTIHSFFQLPFSAFLPDHVSSNLIIGSQRFESKSTLNKHFKLNSNRLKLIRQMELLIIDEVSMLRADLLDALDWMLRSVRKVNTPFGGVQLLFIGDLLQLPPIVKNEEWSVLQRYYDGIHFFNAQVLRESAPIYIELNKIYRQEDTIFINLLENLRNNYLSSEDSTLLDQYVKPSFKSNLKDGFITLTTHNAIADKINNEALKSLKSKSISFRSEINGDFPPSLYPVEEFIELKEGAQIMFIKNDPSYEKNYFNGKMGIIHSLSTEEIMVEFPEENKKIRVDKYEWNNIKYELNEKTGEIDEKILGTFVHYPIRLAWGITVHKSQGLTFDKAILDVSRVFAPGQAYVALSRLRSLNGLVLTSSFSLNGLTNDKQVVAYSQNKANNQVLKTQLEQETLKFLQQELQNAFDWGNLKMNWLQYEYSCRTAGAKTEKHTDKEWTKEVLIELEKNSELAIKFQHQLTNLMRAGTINWTFIQQRFLSAYAYFFDTFDRLLDQILLRKIHLASKKKAKQYIEELAELELEVTNIIEQLMKVKYMLVAKNEDLPFSKEQLKPEELLQFKTKKIEQIIGKHFANLNASRLIESEENEQDVIQLKTRKKEKKEPKKDTYSITFEMFQVGKDIAAIARERQLGVSTIEGHFARLIQQEKIEITDVMEDSRIQEVDRILEDYNGKTLGTIKEELGDLISYAELRWVQASKML